MDLGLLLAKFNICSQNFTSCPTGKMHVILQLRCVDIGFHSICKNADWSTKVCSKLDWSWEWCKIHIILGISREVGLFFNYTDHYFPLWHIGTNRKLTTFLFFHFKICGSRNLKWTSLERQFFITNNLYISYPSPVHHQVTFCLHAEFSSCY
jgi:hypothetical protein